MKILSFQSALLFSALAACASPAPLAEDTCATTAASTLPVCELGISCPAQRLLAAVSAATGAVNVRDDVEAVDFAYDAKVLATGTSRRMTLFPGTRVALAGDATGSSVFAIDDNLLLEALDESGAVQKAATIGPFRLRMNGSAIPTLGVRATSFDNPPLEVSDWLPARGTFRLRLTLLDFVGAARVSEVHLAVLPLRVPGLDFSTYKARGAYGGIWGGGDQTVSASVTIPTAATYVVRLHAYREWTGSPTHALASQPVQYGMAVDGSCAATYSITSTTPGFYEARVALTAGKHTLSIVFLNDYFNAATSADRNSYLEFAELVPTREAAPSLPAASACLAAPEYVDLP